MGKAQQLVANWASIVCTAPFRALAGVALVVLVALSQMVDLRSGALRIEIDPSMESMLSDDDTARAFFDEVQGRFDVGDSVLVALATDDVFTADHLQRLERITNEIERVEHVLRVSSLSSSVNIRSEDGALVVEPFFDEVPSDAAALRDLRQRALQDPIYSGNLVSRDARVALIVAQLENVPESVLVDAGVDARIVEIARREAGDADVWVTGAPHVEAELSRAMLRDSAVVIPLTWLVMAAVAFVSFRTVRGVLIPVASVQLSVLCAFGALARTYGELNMITMATPPVLVVIGLAYAIHVVSAYYDVLREPGCGSLDPRRAMASGLERVGTPVLFAGLTTAAGFFALVLSPLEAVRQFGVFCGMGVLVTVAISLTFVPAVLSLLPVPARLRQRRSLDGLDRTLAFFGLLGLRHPRAIMVGSALVGIGAAFGIFRIDLGTDTISNFQSDNPVRLDFERVSDELQGGNELTVVFEADEPDAFKEPRNLAVLEALQGWLAVQPEVGGSTSLADYVKAIHRGFQDGRPEAFRLPESRNAVSQLLIIGANDELDRFVDGDYEMARVIVRTSAIDSADVMDLVRRIEGRMGELLAAGDGALRGTVTGRSVLLSQTQDELASGQVTSLGAAFVAIYIFISLVLRSPRMGAIALVPNVLPVLVYFGLLGWSGVTLNCTTAIVACLVLGIAVDDTIHLFTDFQRAADRLGDARLGAIEALQRVGRPITVTSLALMLGFLTMMTSEMTGQIEFGWLSAVTLGVAWLVDVTLTPTLAARMQLPMRGARPEPVFEAELASVLSAGPARRSGPFGGFVRRLGEGRSY